MIPFAVPDSLKLAWANYEEHAATNTVMNKNKMQSLPDPDGHRCCYDDDFYLLSAPKTLLHQHLGEQDNDRVTFWQEESLSQGVLSQNIRTPKPVLSRPPHFDEASWRVAQCLLKQKRTTDPPITIPDDLDDEGWQTTWRGRRGTSGRATTPFMFLTNDDDDEMESASLALALQLQEKEASRQWRLQQQQEQASTAGFALALQLAEREEAKRIRNHRLKLKEQALALLRPCQRNALLYVQKEAALLHKQALSGLRERVRVLGHTEETLQNVFEYIRNDAPIIIHLTKETLQKLTKDTHYRSLFETQTDRKSVV